MSGMSASLTTELPLGDACLQSWSGAGADAYAQYRLSNSAAQWAMYHDELMDAFPSEEEFVRLWNRVVGAMVVVGVVVALLI